MGHPHTSQYGKLFAIGIGLNITYVAVEAFYGLLINSSALLADAGHNASDVLSLIFAWLAIWLAAKSPKGRFTYGYKKATILTSLLNALLLFAAVFIIAWEAIEKFQNPVPVPGQQVMVVAGIGVLINTLTALLFMKGRKGDLNIKGAFLHMAADAAVSLGVVLSGFFIIRTGWQWIDPMMSILIIGVIVWSTWKLFIESVNLSLDAAPADVNVNEVESFFLQYPGIDGVHDLHIWALSTTENALTVHLELSESGSDQLVSQLKMALANRFGLRHVTLQVEDRNMAVNCVTC